MNYVIYNPKSSNYKRTLEQIVKKIDRKKELYKLVNFLNYKDKERDFLDSLAKEDVIYFIGGDGSLYYLINKLRDYTLKNPIYLCKAVNGNDFSRNFKEKQIYLNDKIVNLPKYYVDGEENFFINGCGMGVDGLVCFDVNEAKKKNIKSSYFKTAINCFRKFKPYNLDITVDGKDYHFQNVWFFSCMNGCYQGGGMKFSPHSKMGDDILELVVVHDVKFLPLLLLFPFIFIGKHLMFKNVVSLIKGKNFTLKIDQKTYLQADGETRFPVCEVTIKR